MSNLLSPEKGIYKLMLIFYQLIILNMLIIVMSLPIITMGCAITTGYSIAFKLAKGTEGNLFYTYMQSFKKNFRNSTIIWLSLLLLGVIFYWFAPLAGLLLKNVSWLSPLFLLVFSVILLTLPYFFSLTAYFENSVRATIVNAFVLSLKHLPYSIIVFMLVGGGLFFPFLVPRLLFLWIFIGFSLSLYLSGKVFELFYHQYVDEGEADVYRN